MEVAWNIFNLKYLLRLIFLFLIGDIQKYQLLLSIRANKNGARWDNFKIVQETDLIIEILANIRVRLCLRCLDYWLVPFHFLLNKNVTKFHTSFPDESTNLYYLNLVTFMTHITFNKFQVWKCTLFLRIFFSKHSFINKIL